MVIAMLQEAGAPWLVQQAEPWADLYSHSKALSAGVLFLHLVPLLVSGGTALVADRATLRTVRGDASARGAQLAELAASHRLVVSGLALSFVSGVLMFLSDVETFLPSPFFWIKLALVGLLLLNGLAMTRTERVLVARGPEGSDALWARMRTIAVVSAALWLATTLAGVVLAQYA